MKRLWQRIVTIGLAFVLLGVSSFTAFAATEIHIWTAGWNTEVIQWVKDNLVPEFQKRHPDVDVIINPTGWSITEKLILATAAGTAPDIVVTGGTTVINTVPTGLLQPLDRYLQGWDERDVMNPGAFLNARWKGATYSIPQTVDMRLVAYHKDVFSESGLDPESPPQSWEELHEAARLTTKIEGDQLVRRGFDWSWSSVGVSQMYGNFLMQNGGRLISEDSRKPQFNNDLGLEALEFVKQMYVVGHPPGVASPESRGISDFSAQTTAMTRGSYWITRNVLKENPEILDQVGTFVPRRSPKHDPVALSFINGVGIPGGSKNPDLAWEFMTLLAGKESSKAFVSLAGFLSPRKDLADWVQENYAPMVPWFEAMDYIVPWPQIPGGLAGYTTIGDEVVKVIKGEMAPATALERAYDAQVTLINDWWANVENR